MNPQPRLGQLCLAIIDCEHKTAPIASAGVPSVRTSNIKNGRIDFQNANRVTESTYRQWTQRMEPQPGDLILAREAPVGEVGIIPPGQRACLGQRTVLIRPDPEFLNSRYLLYLLLTPGMRHEMALRATGSTVAHLNMSDIRQLQLPLLPSLSEQSAIAAVLGALDDKIEQNRKTVSALERLARALFKAWFVDFEPVKAKAAGAKSFPSMPQDAFDSLPTTFTDSELGPVPEGWEVKPLSKICNIVSGGTPKRSEADYWNGNIPWYSVKDAPSAGQVWVYTTEECISDIGLNNSAAQIVPKGCTIISARGTVGKLALAAQPMTFNQSCYGLMPADGLSFAWLYLSMQSVVTDLQQRTHGSVFDTITRSTFDGLLITAPSGELIRSFEDVVAPLFDLLLAARLESAKLEAMRDYLLPQLLSGIVRVDLERLAK